MIGCKIGCDHSNNELLVRYSSHDLNGKLLVRYSDGVNSVFRSQLYVHFQAVRLNLHGGNCHRRNVV